MINGAHVPLDAAMKRSLRGHYLFSALSEPQWQSLLGQMRALKLTAGTRLFDQGQPADVFYVVCSGSVKLFRESAAGSEKIMRLVKSGQSFAESVLFSEPPHYPVHAQTVSASLLAVVPREPYLALLRESFDTCRAVMAQMVRRIHQHWDEIESLSLLGSQARVARYLFDLLPHDASSGVVTLPAQKAIVAGRLGVAPETLSRGLRFLIDRHIIAVRGEHVEILNPQALRRCAEAGPREN